MKLDEQSFNQLLHTMPLIGVAGVMIRDDRVLLLRREIEPFKGSWVLPGGFLQFGETLEEGIARKYREETKILVRVRSTVNIYSHPHRDPRGQVVVAAFLCDPLMIGDLAHQVEQSQGLGLFPVSELPPNMGFDHGKMITDAVKIKKILDNQ